MIDWIKMLENLALSLVDVEKLVFWVIYLIGLVFVIAGLYGLAAFGMGKHANSDEKFHAILKIFIGSLFIAIPKTLKVMNATLFGQGATLSYEDYHGFSLYDAVKILIQIGGIIWFTKGMIMIIGHDRSEREKSFKALVYILAGTCALNFDYFVSAVTYMINGIFNYFKSLI
jgi:intracellular multiplication protein IcmC